MSLNFSLAQEWALACGGTTNNLNANFFPPVLVFFTNTIFKLDVLVKKQQRQKIIKQNNVLEKKKTLGIVVSVIAFALSYFAVQQLFFKPPTFDNTLMQAASELNKKCPVMVDNATRLDNAEALPGNIFQYNYTIVTRNKAEINIEDVRKSIEPGIINGIKTSPPLKLFRDNKVTMVYNYKDKMGVFLFTLSIAPDKYKNE